MFNPKFKTGLPNQIIFILIVCFEIYSGICSTSNSENLIAHNKSRKGLKKMHNNDRSDFYQHMNFNRKVVQEATEKNERGELRQKRFAGLYPGLKSSFPKTVRSLEPNRNQDSNIESRKDIEQEINSLYFNEQTKFTSEEPYLAFQKEYVVPKDAYPSRTNLQNDLILPGTERNKKSWAKALDGFKSNRYLKHAYYQPVERRHLPILRYKKHFPFIEKYRKLRSFRYPTVNYKYRNGNNVVQEEGIYGMRKSNTVNGHSQMPLIFNEEMNHIKAKAKKGNTIKNGDLFTPKRTEELSEKKMTKKSSTRKNKEDDFIRVQIFDDFSKSNMLERHKKESSIKKNSTENGRISKNKRSKREQTLFIIMALFGLTAIILLIACIALIITRLRSKEKKDKKSKSLNDDKQEKSHAGKSSVASSKSSSGSVFQTRVSKRSFSKTKNMPSSGVANIGRKKSNYRSINSSASDRSSDEEYYLEDSESELNVEQIQDRSKTARKSSSVPIHADKSYNIAKKKSIQAINPSLEKTLETIIIDKTDFNRDFEELSIDERDDQHFDNDLPTESYKLPFNKSEEIQVKNVQNELSYLNIAMYENTLAFKIPESYAQDIQEKSVNESERQSMCPIEHKISYKDIDSDAIYRPSESEVQELQGSDKLEGKEGDLVKRDTKSSNNCKASETALFPSKKLSSNESRSSSTSKNKSKHKIGSPWNRALANIKPRIISENQYGIRYVDNTSAVSSPVIKKEKGMPQNCRGETNSSNEPFSKLKSFTHQMILPSKKHPWSHLVDNTKTVFDSKMDTVILNGFGT